MKKLLFLSAAMLAFQATPVLADNHDYDGDKKGKMFAKKDINGDGVVSKDEFLSYAEKRFEKMDVDGNGSISKDEAKANKKEKREKMKDKRKEWKENKKEKMEEKKESSGY